MIVVLLSMVSHAGSIPLLTLLSYILFIASLIFFSMYQNIIVVMAVIKKKRPNSLSLDLDKSLSIVIPSKNEPIDIVLSRLNRLSSIGCYDEAIIVFDDSLDYIHRVVELLISDFFLRGIIVARLNGLGGRNGALADGTRLALGHNMLIADVDTTPTEEFLCSARKCRDVCVGIWRPYTEVYTRVEEGMAYITRFGSWLFYELRSRIGLFVYPLGAGTVIDRKLLREIGFWRYDVVQDDIWLGYELMNRGIEPKLIDSYIDVGVPKTLNATRVQQCRWSYGSLNIVSRFIGKALKAPISLWKRVEAIIYTLQPISGLLILLSLVLAIISSVVDRDVGVSIIEIIPIVLTLLTQGIALYAFGSSSAIPRLNIWKRLCLAGRAGAIYTLLSPLLGYYALMGLLRVKYVYRITPKDLGSRTPMDFSEAIVLILSLPLLLASIINRNMITFVISLPLVVSAMYSIARLEKG